MGAYLSAFAPYIPYVGAVMLPGVYDFPTAFIRITAAHTNTLPVDAYRGAGRPEASYVIERLVDTAARDLGVAPEALRKKNFIKPKAMPYTTPTDKTYDTGEFAAHLARAQEIADWKGFSKRLAQSKKAGKLRGIGLATYIEACGIAPSAVAGALGARAGLYETGEIRVHPTGSVTVFTGSHSHGQGHETTFAQLVADRLGIPIENVEVSHGDTNKIPFGMGTYGSRSLAVGGSALVKASAVGERGTIRSDFGVRVKQCAPGYRYRRPRVRFVMRACPIPMSGSMPAQTAL